MAAAMVLYSLLRLVFYIYNSSAFPSASAMSFVYGLRFDVVALLYTNIAVILLSVVPSKVLARKDYGIVVASLYVLCNALPFALNLLDVGYFPFTGKRSTFGLFAFIADVPNMGDLIGVFAMEYWILLLIFVAVVVALIFVAKHTMVRDVPDFFSTTRNTLSCVGVRIVILGLVVVGVRGGVQLKPISNSTAAAYQNGNNTALILNTPFSVIRTIGLSELEEKKFFETDSLANEYFCPKKKFSQSNMLSFPPTDNVVIVILEGISSEYSDLLAVPPKSLAGYTPFIDSLAQRSIVFKGFSNGYQSIEALPSILASMPSLSGVPFSKSMYVTNRIDYPTKLFAENGYKMAFFHGAANGTMGFSCLCSILGVNDYYGLDEYPNESDYDGTWGIPDYQYLQYVADVLDGYSDKFMATVFTLTSHHPFVVPPEFDTVLPQGDFPMQHTVAYTDMALQKFFDRVSKSLWYDRTLFVITADHTNFSGCKKIDYDRQFDIPMIFYHPKADTSFISNRIMQQTDIMPSVVSYLGLDGNYTAFGGNVFDTLQERFAVSRNNDYYRFVINGKVVKMFDNDEFTVVDSDDGSSVLSDYERNFIRAFVQCYNNGMRNNSLYSE